MSMAPYWWPNPDTKDGLPYIRKDGEKNPEIFKITDDAYLAGIISSVPILSAAFFITEDPKYSSKAAELLRVWFLDDNTKMNPNLNYAQYVPGRNNGRDAGIIDTHGIYRILDAISILQNSKEWSGDDNLKMKRWLDVYLNWLRTSKNGIDESKTKNNHGTWYDVQVVSILLFNGKHAEAGEYLEKVTKRRIDNQIKEDGKQPEELIRTKAMGYSEFNLTALFRIAVLAERAGVDLWNYKGDDGGSIRKAFDFLLQFVLDTGKWEYKQISPFKSVDVYPLLLQAQEKYDAKIYRGWISRIFENQKISAKNIF
jgi:hypothetical protein